MPSIPYDQIYHSWLNGNCKWSLPVAARTRYYGKILIAAGRIDFAHQLVWSDLTEDGWLEVNYDPDVNYHVAVLLFRKKHPVTHKPTFEYIDSMANPQIERQRALEQEMHRLGQLYGFVYLPSFFMYNGPTSDFLGYNWETPQIIENTFVWSPARQTGDIPEYKEFVAKEGEGVQVMSDERKMQAYMNELKGWRGGDCIFWAHHISGEMLAKGISARAWMVSFRQSVEQAPLPILKYVTAAMLGTIGSCADRDMFALRVRAPDGRDTVLQVTSSLTGQQVKQLLIAALPFTQTQRLFLGDQQLLDVMTLDELQGIRDKGVVLVAQ